MRVLLITHRFMPALGGVETWAHELAEGLTALGHEVVVLARTEGADGSPEAPAAARPYSTHDERRGAQRIRWVVQQHSDEQNFTQSWNNSAMRAVAAGAIRDFTPDLVHIAHNDGWGVAPFRAADEAGLPIVVTLHDYKWICARGQMIRPGGDRCTEANEELCIRCIDRQLASVPARGLLRRVLGQRGQATLAQRDGLRVVENRPDPGPAARGRWRRRQRGLMAALGGADRVTSPSQFVADRLKAAGLSRSALVVRNGSGPRSSENELSPHPSVAPRGPLRIGVFGRPHPTKGFDFLISALVALPAGAAELHFHGVVASDLTDAPPPRSNTPRTLRTRRSQRKDGRGRHGGDPVAVG